MENEFLEFGAIMEVPDGRKIVTAVKKMRDACRESKIPVIYTRMVHEEPSVAPRIYDLFPFLAGKAYQPNSHGVAIHPELAPIRGEKIIEKRNYSAFFGTDLDAIIRGSRSSNGERDTLIFTGLVSHVCVEASLHDAFFRGYKVILTRDGCAGWDLELHRATLKTVGSVYGMVMNCNEIIEALNRDTNERRGSV
jgi:ureidoacrylate peracid hydrolase